MTTLYRVQAWTIGTAKKPPRLMARVHAELENDILQVIADMMVNAPQLASDDRGVAYNAKIPPELMEPFPLKREGFMPMFPAMGMMALLSEFWYAHYKMGRLGVAMHVYWRQDDEKTWRLDDTMLPGAGAMG